MTAATVEVVALHPADAEGAEAGGADRVHGCTLSGDEARSPAPADLSAIVRATALPVRVTLRLSDGRSTQGGELTRLRGLAGEYLACGAEGFVLGFLTPELEIDLDVCAALLESFAGAPWTFDRSFDQALEARRAWRQVKLIPGLDRVHTAGAARGMATGADDLIALAEESPDFAAVATASGGVRAEDVPWLVGAGVTAVHLGQEVRPGGSWQRAHVDAGFVRSWRTLLDDAVRRTGVAAAGDAG